MANEESKASDEAKSKEKKMAKRLVKWMGDSDIRTISRHDNFDGQLPDGVGRDLEWNWDNAHVLDLGDLPAHVVDLVLAEPEFKDVTDLRTIPHNKVHQRRGGRPGRVLGVLSESGIGGGHGSGLGTGSGYTGEGSTASSSGTSTAL